MPGGVAPFCGQVRVEQLCLEDFTNPDQFWDYRSKSLHLKSSESFQDAIWFNNSKISKCVKRGPGWKTLPLRAGKVKSRISCLGAGRNELATRLVKRDEYSWTAVISHHIKSGHCRQALRIYEEMLACKVKPSSYTFVAVLKACCTLQDLDKGKKIHADVVRSGFESVLFVATVLVDMYAKCGSLVDSRNVFEKMAYRDVVSWNCMILGYAQMRDGEMALNLYNRMQQDNILPDHRTFVGVLKGCNDLAVLEEKRTHVKKRTLEQVRAIHSHIVKRGYESNVFVGTMLVDVYAKCGTLGDARSVFEKMQRHTVVSWTAMIFGYALMEEGEVALELFARMQQEGLTPNERTFVGVLKACGSMAGLEKGKEIHSQISKIGLDGMDHPILWNTLIDMYSKCGSMEDAQQVFDALPVRDTVTWGALIAGYARSGENEVVFDLFQKMKQQGLQPDSITFLCVLTVCNHMGLVDKGQKYFEAMCRDHGITPSLEHYTCMIDLLGRAGRVSKGMEMLEMMPFQPDGVVWIAILGACRKWNKVELGRRAFDSAVRLDQTDARAYLLMSSIYAAANMHEAAEEIQEMRVRTRAWKQAGQSWWANTSGLVQSFVVADRKHPENERIHFKLRRLHVRMSEEGYIPRLDILLQDTSAEEISYGHTQKLAIAYRILNVL